MKCRKMPPYSSGSKRPLVMVADDPDTAQQRADKRPRQKEATTSAAEAGAMVRYAAPPMPTVLDVESISAIPPQLMLPPPAAREEPPCLRKHFLVALGLRADLPVHFIDAKRMTRTDLNPDQNRFRIPTDGVEHRLCAILSPRELHEANLLDDLPPKRKPKKKKQQPGPGEPQNSAVAAEGEHQGKKIKEPKQKGRVHGGLPVKLVDLVAGSIKLKMARWDSSQGTVVKGPGYLDFIRWCRFKENDVVEVWAFVQRRFRLFGEDVCDDSLLHVLIVKRNQQQPRCCFCPQCPLPLPR